MIPYIGGVLVSFTLDSASAVWMVYFDVRYKIFKLVGLICPRPVRLCLILSLCRLFLVGCCAAVHLLYVELYPVFAVDDDIRISQFGFLIVETLSKYCDVLLLVPLLLVSISCSLIGVVVYFTPIFCWDIWGTQRSWPSCIPPSLPLTARNMSGLVHRVCFR